MAWDFGSTPRRRRYYNKYAGQKSAWLDLVEGQNYYIEAKHYNRFDDDSFSVAVEIEQTEIVGHHHAIKEIQKIGVVPINAEKDTIRITITNMDTGYFKLLTKLPWWDLMSYNCPS